MNSLLRADLAGRVNILRGLTIGSTPCSCSRLQFSSASGNGSSSDSSHSSSKQHNTADEWTEVIDAQTGQPYYWNQRTGETTALGEEKPQPGSSSSNEQPQAPEGLGQTINFREPVEPDQTFRYTLIGVGVGIFSGWVSQFI